MTFGSGPEGFAIAENGDMLDSQKGISMNEVKNLLMAKEHSGYEKVWVDETTARANKHPGLREALNNNKINPRAKQIMSIIL